MSKPANGDEIVRLAYEHRRRHFANAGASNPEACVERECIEDQVFDFVWDHPGCTTRQVGSAFGWELSDERARAVVALQRLVICRYVDRIGDAHTARDLPAVHDETNITAAIERLTEVRHEVPSHARTKIDWCIVALRRAIGLADDGTRKCDG